LNAAVVVVAVVVGSIAVVDTSVEVVVVGTFEVVVGNIVVALVAVVGSIDCRMVVVVVVARMTHEHHGI